MVSKSKRSFVMETTLFVMKMGVSLKATLIVLRNASQKERWRLASMLAFPKSLSQIQ